MFPLIFEYKIITITTFGVMLAAAFYCSFLLLERELKLRGKNPDLAYQILIVTIPAAIIGAKLFHILDNLDQFWANPKGMIFTGAGLSVYGGLLLSLFACYFVVKRAKESYLEIADIAAPAIALGYGLGRIGCHVSGDGDYGSVTKSIFGAAYPNGIVPSTDPVFLTPLYESLFSFIAFAILMQIRHKKFPTGVLFFIYLLLNAVPRFLVEFIRTNPVIIGGLTQAQLVAIALFITGAAGIVFSYRKKAHA